eukprot:1577416-Amphidinium_carterae.1
MELSERRDRWLQQMPTLGEPRQGAQRNRARSLPLLPAAPSLIAEPAGVSPHQWEREIVNRQTVYRCSVCTRTSNTAKRAGFDLRGCDGAPLTHRVKIQLAIMTKSLWQLHAQRVHASETELVHMHDIIGLRSGDQFAYGCVRCGRHSIAKEYKRLAGSSCTGLPRLREATKQQQMAELKIGAAHFRADTIFEFDWTQ